MTNDTIQPRELLAMCEIIQYALTAQADKIIPERVAADLITYCTKHIRALAEPAVGASIKGTPALGTAAEVAAGV